MKSLPIFFAIAAMFLFNPCFAQTQEQQPVPIKLYAMDCGGIHIANFGGFSDTGDYDNKSVQLVNPCFLIVHPKGTLVWDTGLSDSFIKKPETAGPYQFTKSMTIQDNLNKIDLKPNDIKYVSVSHSHFDHMGSLNQFPKSTWIIQKAELDYAKTHPNPFVIDISKLTSWTSVKKIMISGDHDVFGDGTVQILNTPGHTPGHQSLKINLPKTGVVILSGDEFHQRASVEPLRIPVPNTNRAETMASADRIKTLVKNTNGRLIVQHDEQDFEKLPKFPSYLE